MPKEKILPEEDDQDVCGEGSNGAAGACPSVRAAQIPQDSSTPSQKWYPVLPQSRLSEWARGGTPWASASRDWLSEGGGPTATANQNLFYPATSCLVGTSSTR